MLFTVIGDMVGSRVLPDRGAAQRRVNAALATVQTVVPGEQPLEPTVGDEFQGGFATLGAAVRAALLVRLELLPAVDVRCGLGAGEVTLHDGGRRPLLQDGPGWWAARDALEALERSRRPSTRTWYAPHADASTAPDPARVNAFLLVRDALLERLNERSLRMLRLALLGESQQRIAVAEGVSKSAVSQAFARGVGAVLDAQRTFEEG